MNISTGLLLLTIGIIAEGYGTIVGAGEGTVLPLMGKVPFTK
ncbi:hypothetical protein [Radiobacillus sp. PE A8.2]